jgi:cytochrome c-type biogenesis protein CcmE
MRLWVLSLILVGAGALLTFILVSLQQEMLFFVTPSQLNQLANEPKKVRLGGLVKEGSVARLDDGLSTQFIVTDHTCEQKVYYRGILPDLFREGQGVVAEGRKNHEGIFIATQVLAKHDETYMPKAVYQQLRKSA